MDEDDLDCKRLLSEVDTALLLDANADAKEQSASSESDEALYRGSLEFLRSAAKDKGGRTERAISTAREDELNLAWRGSAGT